jgi:formylglycine-generating enzyme required for sulfatase activity
MNGPADPRLLSFLACGLAVACGGETRRPGPTGGSPADAGADAGPPADACARMCDHVYATCGLVLVDSAGVDISAEDCPEVCRGLEDPSPVACLTEIECTGSAAAACLDPSGPGADRISIPAGTFLMGCDEAVDPLCADPDTEDERPVHAVTLSAYRIDRVEVTQADFQACLDAGRCTPPACDFDPVTSPDRPVACVTVEQARAFCAFAGGRLPTEAEWERAARGDTPRLYPWGSAPPEDCVHIRAAGCADAVPETRSAGASPFGVLDLAGGVAELVNDFYALYPAQPQTDPTGPAGGSRTVVRGGRSPFELRTSWRAPRPVGASDFRTGFRCAE